MLIPFGRINIRVDASIQTVLARLGSAIAAPSILPALTAPNQFRLVGTVDGRTFSVRPIIRGRNSFLPTLVGQLIDDGNSRTVLACQFNPNPAVFVALLGAVALLVVQARVLYAALLVVASLLAFAVSASFARRRLFASVSETAVPIGSQGAG